MEILEQELLNKISIIGPWSRHLFKDKCLTFYDADLVDGRSTNIALRFNKNGSVEEIEAPPLQPISKTKWLIKRVARSDREFSPISAKPCWMHHFIPGVS